jgi:glycosyltransferase involved in cell wall biosynthesis
MKIVHIGPPHLPVLYALGGAIERRMRELARRQADAGAEVILYSAEDKTQTMHYHGAEVRALACNQKDTVRAAEFMYKAMRDVRSVSPDVIHFHSLVEGAAFASWFARGMRAKTLLSFDFFEFRRGRENPFFPWYKKALNRFSELLPVSEYCRSGACDYWSIPQDRMRVLYNGVSIQQFFPDPQASLARRSALGIAGDEFVLLYVGRVCEQKGTDLLVEAYRMLRNEHRRVRLVIAGPIGQFGTSGSNGITDALEDSQGIYLGPVEEAILPSVYNMADVFVMPTRQAEMFGMAAIEAQACGVPVVCSNHGGLPEVINPKSGLLFETGSAMDLARNLRALMDNPELKRRCATAAVPNAERFSWENIVRELNQVYA